MPSPFNDKDLNYIYRASGGLPGGINILAKQVMMENLLPEKSESGVTRYILGLGFIAAIAAGIYFGGYTKNLLQLAKPFLSSEEVPVEVVENTGSAVNADRINNESSATEETPNPIDRPDESVADDSESMEEQMVVPVEDAMPEEVEPVLPPEENNTAALEDSEDFMVANIEPELEEDAVEEAMTPEAEEVSQSFVEEEVDGEAPAEADDEVDIASINTDTLSQDAVSVTYASLKGASWIKQQPDDYYALQLISARDVESVEDLLKGLPEETLEQISTYTNYTPSGKARYLLLYGLYPKKKIADVAVEELPEKLQEVKPWPRRLSSVVNEIDKVLARGLDVRN